jgi:hypothetical protein
MQLRLPLRKSGFVLHATGLAAAAHGHDAFAIALPSLGLSPNFTLSSPSPPQRPVPSVRVCGIASSTATLSYTLLSSLLGALPPAHPIVGGYCHLTGPCRATQPLASHQSELCHSTQCVQLLITSRTTAQSPLPARWSVPGLRPGQPTCPPL